MGVRAANFSDIPRLYELAEEMHKASVYANRCTLDKSEFRSLCFFSISNHGNTACLFVYESNGNVDGFIMGTLDRVYGIAKEFYATDLFFFVGDGGSPRAAPKLLQALTEWGETRKNVIEVFLGISGAIGDYERISKMYEKKGFRKDGLMMVKEVDLEQDC